MERRNNRDLFIMRLILTIMLPLVLSLSLMPCCPPLDACSDHAEQSCDDEPLKGTSQNSGLCSPFYTCGNCPGFIFEQIEFLYLPIQEVDKTGVEEITEFKAFSLTISLFKPPQG
ncbi:hypothetical protein KZP23_16295 [Echinicola marina]|uniref:hypothetical protein n=1 Tax=Echinicola marina TaxID=2859768 RepID=UPI001CF6F241|nr:hypothetical protein [Echinicola marina]UCS92254.1 hypothetical protein KZP23_16295 [Echinicola marina]